MVESTVSIDYNIIPCNKEEKEALIKFKEAIAQSGINVDDNIDDHYLIRFLRARKLKIDKTMEMFKKYLSFREEFQIKTIKTFEFPEENDILSYYPQGLHKVDKLGRPIYYELLGKLDLEKLTKVTDLNRLFKYSIKNLEYFISDVFPAASKAANTNIHQFFYIVDLKGFSKKLLSTKVYNYLRNTLSSIQNYYPEMLGQMIIINSNLVFKACWTVIKTFLDTKTKSKILFFGKDYKNKLLEYVRH